MIDQICQTIDFVWFVQVPAGVLPNHAFFQLFIGSAARV